MAIPVVPRGTDGAKVVELIETRSIKGAGTIVDPCRMIAQYWTKDGRFVSEADPAPEVLNDYCEVNIKLDSKELASAVHHGIQNGSE